MSSDKLQRLLNDLVDDDAFAQAMLEEDLIHRVALRVLRVRKAAGMSQADLANAIGTRQPAVARIEAGEANMTLRSLAQLAFALGCEPEHLVSEGQPAFLISPWRGARPGNEITFGGPGEWMDFIADVGEKAKAA